MEEAYKQSLLLIKTYKIRTQAQYLKLAKEYFILNTITLKILSNTKDFNKIVEYARKMEV
jgi:hypothetical protein